MLPALQKDRSLRFIAYAAVFLAMSPAYAHHGWSEYDATKPLKLTGTIVESGYEHPHGHVRLKTEAQSWSVVLAPPTRMANRGLPGSALRNGATVTVVGYPSRSKPEEMRAERITVDGKTVELR